jgi:hypothetical protein
MSCRRRPARDGGAVSIATCAEIVLLSTEPALLVSVVIPTPECDAVPR